MHESKIKYIYKQKLVLGGLAVTKIIINRSLDRSTKHRRFKMTQLQHWAMDPFDIMWKNFFDKASNFNSIKTKIDYPVDIYETETGLRFELAVVGLEKKHIKILVDGNTLRVIHDGDSSRVNREYIQKGIVRRSFDLIWRVSDKFNLSKLEANMENGLLILDIPTEPTKTPKEISIK